MVLAGVIVILSALNGLTLVAEFGFGRDHVKGLVPMFRLNEEGNIPTFFSASMLLFISIVMILIWRAGGKARWQWLALSGVAAFMACDEAAQIHEMLDHNREWTNGLFEPTGALVGPWVVVYGLIVLAFVAVFLQFYLRLPRKTRLLLGIAGALYVGGAIGLEMIGAAEWSRNEASLVFEIINSGEEMMEMTALAIAIYALIDYAQRQFGWRRIVLAGA